jgi:hypothetical protein
MLPVPAAGFAIAPPLAPMVGFESGKSGCGFRPQAIASDPSKTHRTGRMVLGKTAQHSNIPARVPQATETWRSALAATAAGAGQQR